MRPETVFILSSLDVRTLAEFPPVLDPCVNEALRNEKVITEMAGKEYSVASLRKADVNVREAVAKAILNVAVAEVGEIATPTPIPGVVMPKPETGLTPLPLTIPTMVPKIPEAGIEGANTIEFQELIPGIKPPAIPLLIPGLEKLPLLPGWTIRTPEGRVVSEGARIPTLPPGIIGIPIPEEMPGEGPGPGALAILGADEEYLAPEEEYYPEESILEETGMEIAPVVPAEMLGGNMLELGDGDGVEDMILTGELEEESLEL